MSDSPIKVTGEFTPDPHVCKFIVDAPLLEDWTLIFKSREESLGSPLVDALFGIAGIARVQVSGSVLTLTKDEAHDVPWPQLARDIVPEVRRILELGEAPISQAAVDAVAQGNPEDLFSTIEELFENQINPALASHGGFVRLVKIEDRDVYLEMGGGCQGCSASQATLRHGIETAVRQAAPQVRQILDVTDHAAGTHPYFQ